LIIYGAVQKKEAGLPDFAFMSDFKNAIMLLLLNAGLVGHILKALT